MATLNNPVEKRLDAGIQRGDVACGRRALWLVLGFPFLWVPWLSEPSRPRPDIGRVFSHSVGSDVGNQRPAVVLSIGRKEV